MTNPQLMGVLRGGRADHFNLKGSLCVIALFGVITIISYFNELNKAGLLRRGVIPHPVRFSEHRRLERSVEEEDDDNLIQKDVELHQLGLEILKLKKISQDRQSKGGEEINIKLHLRQNSSYEKINNSIVPIYHHKNSLPNFYTTFNMSLCDKSAFNSTAKVLSVQTNAISTAAHALAVLRKKYQNAVLVFAHQHEPHGHLLRDCLKNISREKKLVINNMPINDNFRKQWNSLSKPKKNLFDVLHGGATFGVCETIGRPCSYIALMAHPVDRLVALYELCQNASMESWCKLNNVDGKQITLRQFIIAQGSNLFGKLVYNAKHCRLVGEGELCLQGSRTSFELSQEKTGVHLKHILQHVESWFAAIGLVERFSESLALLQSIYGYAFSECHKRSSSLYGKMSVNQKTPAWLSFVQKAARGWVHPGVLPVKRRNALLRDRDVKRALHADLVIYDKMVELYKKQVKNKQLIHAYLTQNQKVKSGIKKTGHTVKGTVKPSKAYKRKGQTILNRTALKVTHALHPLPLKYTMKNTTRKKPMQKPVEGLQKYKVGKHQKENGTKVVKNLMEKHAPSKLTLGKGAKGNHTMMARLSNKTRKEKQNQGHRQSEKDLKEKRQIETKIKVVRGEVMLKHPKKQVVPSIRTALKVTRSLHQRQVKRRSRKKPTQRPVQGLDEMLVQNLSALELSKFHAEGVRPGMLEKSNAIHLRALPHIAHRGQTRKQTANKDSTG